MNTVLTLTILSFSYKHGLHAELSPHGGGFMFDCRCLPNPGREAAYQEKNGRDREVREYLERHAAVQDFFSHCRALVEQALRSYQERGFEQLLVAFGCTGGQHRSVYFAERLAAELRTLPAVAIRLIHQELDGSKQQECS